MFLNSLRHYFIYSIVVFLVCNKYLNKNVKEGDNMKKSNVILEQFNSLQENFTPVNVIQYIDFLKTRPAEEILENSSYIFVEPTRGADFLYHILECHDFTLADMENVHQKMSAYITKCVEGGYSNNEHLETVNKCRTYLYEQIAYKQSDEYLKESTIQFFENQKEKLSEVLTEGAVETAVRFHNKLLRPIALNGAINGSKLGVKLVGGESKEAATKEYIRRISYEIQRLQKERDKYDSKVNVGDHVKDTLTYGVAPKAQIDHMIDMLTQAVEFQKGQLKQIQKGAVKENIGMMAPDIVYADEKDTSIPILKKEAQLDFSINFAKTFMDDSSVVNMESFNKMMQAAYRLDSLEEQEEILSEGLKDVAKKAAIRSDEIARKVVVHARKVGNETRRVTNVAKRVPGHLDRAVDNTIGQIGKMDQAERRNRIIQGGFKFKLLKIIGTGIAVGAAWAVHPALAAIGILAKLILDRKLDDKARNGIVDELEIELKLTKEKIKDAEQKGDNQAKYQLMRIEDALEKDLERVKYRLDAFKVSKKGVKI
jgi:hypothetical protein